MAKARITCTAFHSVPSRHVDREKAPGLVPVPAGSVLGADPAGAVGAALAAYRSG
jgi:hypothetical protein